ncbi:MAG: sensor domain-containing diguanylate cyclase [Xanthomonadaceae bacterium]|nr:sensor domain-containing diguanylate cyclase [Xanthomonadaceae bacterium]
MHGLRLPTSDPRARWRGHAAAMLCALLALLAAGSARAQAPVLEVDRNFRSADLLPHLALLRDRSREMDIAAARAAAAEGRFERAREDQRGMGFDESAWWARAILRNTGDRPLRLVVRQNYPLTDFVDLWTADGVGGTLHVATGDLLPFGSRPIRHHEFLVPIDVPAGAEQQVYIRIQTEGSLNLGLSLHAADELLEEIAGAQMMWGGFYGSIALLALGALLLFVLVRDAAFGHYAVYLVTYGCYMAAYNGLSFQYLWPDSPRLASLSQLILLPLSLFFLLQFSRAILGLTEVAPRLERVALVLQGLLLACIPLAFVASYRLAIQPLAALTLATIAFLIVAAVYGVLAGRVAARFYLSGLGVFLLGVLVYMLKTYGWLPHNALTQHGFQVGSLAEFVLLSVALGVRMNELKRTGITDTLTGLGNRRHFDDVFAAEFEIARSRRRDLALLVVDIDRFKQLNDTRGHAEGDRALRALSAILQRVVRKPDAAFRYGGEEFVVMMPGSGADAAVALAEQLRTRVQAETASGHALTISVGVADMDMRSAATAEEMFQRADASLYAAKAGGRNRVVLRQADRGRAVPGEGARAS